MGQRVLDIPIWDGINEPEYSYKVYHIPLFVSKVHIFSDGNIIKTIPFYNDKEQTLAEELAEAIVGYYNFMKGKVRLT